MKYLSLLIFFIHALAFAQSGKVELYFYINADNDLVGVSDDSSIFHYGENTFNTISEIASQKYGNNEVGVHLYFDPNSFATLTDGNSTLVSYCNSELVKKTLMGESDSSDSANLKSLVDASCFSSEDDVQRILFFWGHGNPWEKIPMYDNSSRNDDFTYALFANALENKKFEGIVFDACAMGALEVMQSFSPFTKNVVASQFDLPAFGIQYDGLADYLNGELDFSRLYFNLRKHSDLRNRANGFFSPLVLYKMEDLDRLTQSVGQLSELFNKVDNDNLKDRIHQSSRFFNNRVFPLQDAIDLRRFIYFMFKNGTIDQAQAGAILSNLQNILYNNFGSITFHLQKSESIKGGLDEMFF